MHILFQILISDRKMIKQGNKLVALRMGWESPTLFKSHLGGSSVVKTFDLSWE